VDDSSIEGDEVNRSGSLRVEIRMLSKLGGGDEIESGKVIGSRGWMN